MRLILTATAVAALAACGSPAANGKEAEAEALITVLERQVTLPDASRTLGGYERYYTVSQDRIDAVYLLSPQGTGRIHLVDQLPQAKAEGCSAVNLVFDRASNRFQRILCNDVRLTRVEPDLKTDRTPAPKGERG